MSLQNHEEFETLLSGKYPIAMVKFGATWCGPCKRIDKDMLLGLSDKIVWYDCDLDENEETPAYCGVSTIPSFLAIVNGVPQPLFQSSDTRQVVAWMQGGFKLLGK
jgi:thiol-disulfide isomerase/thioredoxin